MKHIKPFTFPSHYSGDIHIYNINRQEVKDWITCNDTDFFYVAIDGDGTVYVYTGPPLIEDNGIRHFVYDTETYIFKFGRAAIDFEYPNEYVFTVTGFTRSEILKILEQ